MSDRPHNQILFYNVEVGRPQGQVCDELRALLNHQEPDLHKRPGMLGLCETVGYDMPQVGGYHLIRQTGTQSRANISAYAREDLFGGGVEWTDLEFTWPKPHGSGRHAPRSYVRFRLGKILAYVHHQPPNQIPDAADGQWEGIDSLAANISGHITDEHSPAFVVADWNRKKNESHGPSNLANKIGGGVKGSKIDALVRHGDGSYGDPAYITSAHGVKLCSDHGHALKVQLDASAGYWTP